MKILIAGGRGYIGSALTNLLVDRGYRVTILSRKPEPLRNGEISIMTWDSIKKNLRDSDSGNFDAVVNLTGENLASGRWTRTRFNKIYSSRIEPGFSLLEMIRNGSQKPLFFFQASAVGYYGNHDDQILTEEDQPGQDVLSKLVVDWEAATKPVEDLGVRWVAGRTGIVLSEDSKALKPLLLQNKLFAGGSLGNGEQWWSWITLADTLKAIIFLLENDQTSGPYNLAAPDPKKMKDFGKTLAKVLGRPYWFHTPAFILKMVMGEMSTILLDGQRVMPDKLQKAGFQFDYPDLNSALRSIID